MAIHENIPSYNYRRQKNTYPLEQLIPHQDPWT